MCVIIEKIIKRKVFRDMRNYSTIEKSERKEKAFLSMKRALSMYSSCTLSKLRSLESLNGLAQSHMGCQSLTIS